MLYHIPRNDDVKGIFQSADANVGEDGLLDGRADEPELVAAAFEDGEDFGHAGLFGQAVGVYVALHATRPFVDEFKAGEVLAEAIEEEVSQRMVIQTVHIADEGIHIDWQVKVFSGL